MPIPAPVEMPPPPSEPPAPPVATPKVRVVRAKVTACSPQDPKDHSYYKKNGYEGRLTRAVAADPRMLSLGTQIIVPGYAGDSWVPVDSKGGSVIRRSTRRGVLHLDVKFKTYAVAKQWGCKYLDVTILEE